MTRIARPALTTTSAICRSDGELLPFSAARRKRSTSNATLIAIHQPWRRRLGRPRRRGAAPSWRGSGRASQIGHAGYTRRSPASRAGHPIWLVIVAAVAPPWQRRFVLPDRVTPPNDRLHCNRVPRSRNRASHRRRPSRARRSRPRCPIPGPRLRPRSPRPCLGRTSRRHRSRRTRAPTRRRSPSGAPSPARNPSEPRKRSPTSPSPRPAITRATSPAWCRCTR